MTTRHEEAAKEIFKWLQFQANEKTFVKDTSAIIAKHYRELEDAATRARDVINQTITEMQALANMNDDEWCREMIDNVANINGAALDALNAVLTNAPNQH